MLDGFPTDDDTVRFPQRRRLSSRSGTVAGSTPARTTAGSAEISSGVNSAKNVPANTPRMARYSRHASTAMYRNSERARSGPSLPLPGSCEGSARP